MIYLYAFLVLWSLFLLAQLHFKWRLNKLRRAGLYPQPGQANLQDVHRLLQSNQRILAIRCYREIHPQIGLTEAKRAVETLHGH